MGDTKERERERKIKKKREKEKEKEVRERKYRYRTSNLQFAGIWEQPLRPDSRVFSFLSCLFLNFVSFWFNEVSWCGHDEFVILKFS